MDSKYNDILQVLFASDSNRADVLQALDDLLDWERAKRLPRWLRVWLEKYDHLLLEQIVDLVIAVANEAKQRAA